MRVLIIDPRCTDGSNLYHYTMGLAEGVSEYAETKVVSVNRCTIKPGKKYKVLRWFYPVSERLNRGKFRQVLRGIEYILSYILIWLMTIPKQYDVIHIEWPIVYRLDPIIYKLIKKHCRILSLKAHNVLPHSSDDKYIQVFDKIYSIPDVILVHGEEIKKEFISKFPEYESKLQIQRHGAFLDQKREVNDNLISGEVKAKINSYKRVYLFFGRIDRDKGLDRLVKIWVDEFENRNSLLVIAGAVSPAYKEFLGVETEIKKCSNILYLPGFVDENLLSYLLVNCNLIILPYIRGSMSGVAFTAATYGCPILSTRFGAIEEYITNEVDGLIVSNDNYQLKKALLKIDNEYRNEQLKEIGNTMSSTFSSKYSWLAIGNTLVNDIYATAIDKVVVAGDEL